MQPVAHARRLGHGVVARLDEEADLGGPISQPHRRQLRLPGGHAGDRQGIASVALASTAGAAALTARELRRDLAHGQALGHQEAGGGRAIAR